MLAGCSTSQPQGQSSGSENPQQTGISTGPDGTIIWKLTTQHGIQNDPVVLNGVAYFRTTDNYLLAIDTSTGKLKWETNVGSEILIDPIIVDNTVYCMLRDNSISAYDASTGQQKWKVNDGGGFNDQSHFFVSNGVIYFETDNSICAYDASTGQQKWKEDLRNTQNNEMIGQILCVSNDVICCNGYYGLDTQTGKQKWAFNLPFNSGQQYSTPQESDGIVYFVSGEALNGVVSTYISALDTSSGQQKWKSKISNVRYSNNPIYYVPIISNGVIYLRCESESGVDVIQAFDAATGQLKWKADLQSNSWFKETSDSIVSGYGSYSQGGSIQAFDKNTGNTKWKKDWTEKDHMTYSNCLGGTEGMIYLYSSSDGDYLNALDSSTGQLKWIHKLTYTRGANQNGYSIMDPKGVICAEVDPISGEFNIYGIN